MHNDQAADFLASRENNSSIFEKTTPALRREINKALIDRDPPTYKGVFAKFKLSGAGITYHAFYRYARRVRSQAAMFEMTEATATAGTDLPALLPKILAQRLLEVLAFEDVSPRHIQRLTDAYKTAVNTQVLIRRHGLFRNKHAPDAGASAADLLTQFPELAESEQSPE